MTKKINPVFVLLIMLAAAVSLIGCREAAPPISQDISAAEAHVLIQQSAANPDFVILDVRTTEEYSSGHLENAVLVDFNAENFRGEVAKLAKDDTYLVYCRSGARSRSAADVMAELGFQKVYNMQAGFNEWQAEGFPVVP